MRWPVDGAPDFFDRPAGRDGVGVRWPLRTDAGEQSFTMVYISAHAWHGLYNKDSATRRTLDAVASHGRSEVERHLDAPIPPRVIEVATFGDPRVTATRG